jgi:hypothetical protein
MEIFSDNYDGYLLLRPSFINEVGQKVIDIYAPAVKILIKVTLIFINNDFLKCIDNEKV